MTQQPCHPNHNAVIQGTSRNTSSTRRHFWVCHPQRSQSVLTCPCISCSRWCRAGRRSEQWSRNHQEGTFDDDRPGCSKQDKIVKVFMLMTAVGTCSDWANTRYELQDELILHHEVNVSISTLLNTLHCLGITSKIVCQLQLVLHSTGDWILEQLSKGALKHCEETQVAAF